MTDAVFVDYDQEYGLVPVFYFISDSMCPGRLPSSQEAAGAVDIKFIKGESRCVRRYRKSALYVVFNVDVISGYVIT